MWSGKSAPGDPGATGLLQAVRNSTAGRPGGSYGSYDSYNSYGSEFDDGRGPGATQVIPRLDETQPNPVITAPHQPGRTGNGPLLPPMRQAVGAYDAVDTGPYGQEPYEEERYEDGEFDETVGSRSHRHGTDTVRHAYYPGRRMNLGVVLLPMRVFLGFISIYAGMGKLCDPVYFDGGDRGSMVKWLTSLHPWALAEPLRDFALSHPVGAGLTVAFLQVVVGVLTVLGLWQRVAASVGALLSATLLVTVSWRTVAVYDAPDIIYLAAWSPLIIAGAPVYSVDGRLAERGMAQARPALHDLGPAPPRTAPGRSRRHRRRRAHTSGRLDARRRRPLLRGRHRARPPRQPDQPAARNPAPAGVHRRTGVAHPRRTEAVTLDVQLHHPVRAGIHTRHGHRPRIRPGPCGAGQPSQTQGTGQQPPPRTTPQQPPTTSSGPTSSGSTGTGGGSTGGGSNDGGSTGSTSGGTSGGGRNPIGGLLG